MGRHYIVLNLRQRAGVCLVCLAWTLAATPLPLKEQASNLYKQGRKAEKAGEMARAYLLYSQAAALAPEEKTYWLRSQAVRTRAAMQSKFTIPSGQSDSAEESDADPPPEEPITPKDLRDSKKPGPPTELKPLDGLKDFNLKGTARELFTQVAQAFGLDAVFDGEYPDAGAPIVFRMEQAGYREALHGLASATASFVVPLTDRVFMAVKDTQQKRNDVEPAVTVVIPIPQATSVQEAQEVARAVQQVMEIKRFGIDSARRLVILNGPVSKVRPAQKLFEDLTTYRPQVRVDLEFLEVNRTDALSWGLTLPTTFPITPLTTVLHNKPSLASGLSYVLFGGGASLFAIGVAGGQVNANFNKSDARTLLKTNIRSVDGQPATFHVGTKYPVLTGGYFGPSSFSGPGAYTPPPSFTFEDLGLVLKVTPHIQGDDDVMLEIEAEFKVLGGAALNGIPIISSRKLTSKVQLKANESGLVAGMMSTDEAHTISGLAGLSQIPGFGPLLRQNSRDKDSNEVIIVLKPVMLYPPPEDTTKAVWVGTESRPVLPL